MEEVEVKHYSGLRVREDVPEGSTLDKIINCSWNDVNLVLKDWKKIMANFKKISLGVSQKFFLEYPACKSLFPGFSEVHDYDLAYNEDYLRHAYAVMKGINSIMTNLSGEYEEENVILPTIGVTHLKRGISLSMMKQMKDAIVFVCCEFLNSNKQERASWAVVLNYIFEDYICRAFPKPEKGDHLELQVRSGLRESEIGEETEPENSNGTPAGSGQGNGDSTIRGSRWKPSLLKCEFNFGVTPSSRKKKPNSEYRKTLKAFKSDRRSSSAEAHQMDRTLENDTTKGETLQVIGPPLNQLRRQSMLTNTPSPTLSDRRPSRTLLHPEHAKLMTRRKLSLLTPPLERYVLSLEETPRESRGRGFISSPMSSSGNSSVNSISTGPTANIYDHLHNDESRRSSTTTNKYSLLDALDLEYALIKAAARGSVGTYSLSQSLQKLTFTQSLAFPALARGLSSKRNSSQRDARGALDSLDSGVNAFAKVTTVLILMLISVLVFGVLYKFIRT